MKEDDPLNYDSPQIKLILDHSPSGDEIINPYDQVLFALKGQRYCEQERKDFTQCRATSVGRSQVDPSFCEP